MKRILYFTNTGAFINFFLVLSCKKVWSTGYIIQFVVHIACKHVSQSLHLFGPFLEVVVLDRQWIYFSMGLSLLSKSYCSQQSFTFSLHCMNIFYCFKCVSNVLISINILASKYKYSKFHLPISLTSSISAVE